MQSTLTSQRVSGLDASRRRPQFNSDSHTTTLCCSSQHHPSSDTTILMIRTDPCVRVPEPPSGEHELLAPESATVAMAGLTIFDSSTCNPDVRHEYISFVTKQNLSLLAVLSQPSMGGVTANAPRTVLGVKCAGMNGLYRLRAHVPATRGPQKHCLNSIL